MAVADLPPRIESPVQEVQSIYALEGDSSQQLVGQFKSAFHQWTDRPGYLANSKAADEEHQHVPFASAGRIKVRFSPPKRMKPRQLDLSDDTKE